MGLIEIKMPKLGTSMETGQVARWTRKVGDEVARGEVIAEIETDKVTVEIEATADGRLVSLCEEGVDIPVGRVIAHLDERGRSGGCRGHPPRFPS